VTNKGQCIFLAIPPGTYCPIHNGLQAVRSADKQELYNLNKTEVLIRLQQFRDHPDSAKLTTELGVLRLTLETLLNKLNDNFELITNSAIITNLINSIEKTLSANFKLEQHMNDLLSLTQVIIMAQSLFNIITQFVKDPDIIETIAQEFEQILKNPPDKEVK
jgi:hypothetical protein